jgi:hypothetical protein
MNYDYVIRKVQKQRDQGALSPEESKVIEKALRAWKQRFLMVALLIALSVTGRALWTTRDRPRPGTTQYSSQGAVWEFRWVSAPPKTSISFFTGEGHWQYRPGNRSGNVQFDDNRVRYRYKPGHDPPRPPVEFPKDVDNSNKPQDVD